MRVRTIAPVLLCFACVGAHAQIVPVDLNGTYTAARNFTNSACTDSRGLPPANSGHVREAGREGTFTPFSDEFKQPAFLQNLDLRGKWFQFDIDLGNPADWPNPDSTYEYQDGLAAEGHKGTTFLVRVANSNGSRDPGTFMDLSHDNGVRIAFYRRDNRFWAHLRNTWYAWDLELPNATGGRAWRVRWSHSGFEAFNVAFTEILTNGFGQTKSYDFAGGCLDYVGIRDGSFLVQMINRTNDPSIRCATVKVANFITNAVPDALFTWPSKAYVPVGTPVSVGLFASNLSAATRGYRAEVSQTLGGLLNLKTAGYNPASPFKVNDSPAAPTGGVFRWAQRIATGGTTQDWLLAGATFNTPTPGVEKVMTSLKFNTTLRPGFQNADGSFRPATLLDTPRVWVDGAPPVLEWVSVTQDGRSLDLNYRPGPIRVTFDARDFESGIEGAPQVVVMDPVRGVSTYSARHIAANRFTLDITPSPAAEFVGITIAAIDRAGQFRSSGRIYLRQN